MTAISAAYVDADTDGPLGSEVAIRADRAQGQIGFRVPVGVAVWFVRLQQHWAPGLRRVLPVMLDLFLVRVGNDKALAAVQVEVVGRQREEGVVAGGKVRSRYAL